MSSVFTAKQTELIRLFKKGGLKRINLLEGSVSSGKTYISVILWYLYVATCEESSGFLMVGKTLKSLKRNVLDLLEKMVGEENFTYSMSSKEGVLFGKRIYLEGVNDARAESKIRGLTLIGAYVDEATLMTEDFFVMLLSRLRVPGAKLIATTNPDCPHHWLKTNFIDRADELDMLDMKFTLDDNTFLARDYVESVKKEYVGAFYDRFILGKWKNAEGCVYPLFADDKSRFIIKDINPDDIMFAVIGVDFGGNNSAHAFVLNGFTRGFKEVVTLDECYVKEKISPSELDMRFADFVRRAKEKYKVYDVYCDSAETTLIEGLKSVAYTQRLGVDIRLAKKGAITDRIRLYNKLMSYGRYFVLEKCVHLIEALESAVWKDKSVSDVRLDDGNMNVDSLDALEYTTESYARDLMV